MNVVDVAYHSVFMKGHLQYWLENNGLFGSKIFRPTHFLILSFLTLQLMRITIIHPDLGIGGAERLVVDAAVAMKQYKHQVQFVTNYYRPEHSFKETQEFR